MAHTNYFLDPSYWSVSGGNLQTGSLISRTIAIYLFNPSTLDSNGFNKSSANLTLAQMNVYKTTLTSANTVPNASDFTLANWTAKGWGSTLSDVLTNYNSFVNNNWDNSTEKLSLNPGSQPLTSYIISGSVGGTSYFIPMLAFANQSSSGLVTGFEGFIPVGDLGTDYVNSSYDDSYIEIYGTSGPGGASGSQLPFDFYFFGTNYKNSIYLGSNTYFTFGYASTQYSGLSASSPGRAIHLGSADNSFQRVYKKTMTRYGQTTQVIRYEGTNSTGGVIGSPNIVLQVTFFPGQKINVTVGDHGRTSGQVGITNGVSYQPSFSISPNTSYAISSDPLGNTWTVETGKYFS